MGHLLRPLFLTAWTSSKTESEQHRSLPAFAARFNAKKAKTFPQQTQLSNLSLPTKGTPVMSTFTNMEVLSDFPLLYTFM